MLSDDLGEKKNWCKGLNFSMWASFHLRNIALKFFSLGCSSFSRNNICNKGLCYDKSSRSFVIISQGRP